MDSKGPRESVETPEISEGDWESAYAPSVVEYSAEKFVFRTDADGKVRLALSSGGSGFECAVTLPPYLAIELARQLLVIYATVKHHDDV